MVSYHTTDLLGKDEWWVKKETLLQRNRKGFRGQHNTRPLERRLSDLRMVSLKVKCK